MCAQNVKVKIVCAWMFVQLRLWCVRLESVPSRSCIKVNVSRCTHLFAMNACHTHRIFKSINVTFGFVIEKNALIEMRKTNVSHISTASNTGFWRLHKRMHRVPVSLTWNCCNLNVIDVWSPVDRCLSIENPALMHGIHWLNYLWVLFAFIIIHLWIEFVLHLHTHTHTFCKYFAHVLI